MKNKKCFLLICAVAGYAWGLNSEFRFDFSSRQSSTVDLSSQSEMPALNNYSNLPCPSEKHFRNLARYVNLEIPKGPSLDKKCDNSHRAIFGKSLLLMSRLKFQFPDTWPEKLRTNLSNPLRFLKDRSAKLTLDLSQKDSLAYNKVQDKEIFLGGRFFTIDPLVGIDILIHEARHSEPQANSHTHCEAGDIPRSTGACDKEFSLNDDTAGAYAYGTLFNFALALYAENLAVSDREAAQADALAELGSRFNQIPEVLAKKHDALALLTENSEIKWHDPLTNKWTTLKLEFDSRDEKPVRLEFYPKHNGVLIYTSLQQVWSWHPIRGLAKFYPELLSKKTPIFDVARTRIPFDQITLYVLREKDNALSFVEYSPAKNKLVKSEYPYRAGNPKIPLPISPFKKMFLALFEESVFLTEDGKLYLAPHYGNDAAFGELPSLQSPVGWVAGTGGAVYDALYLIDQRGELSFVELSSRPIEGNSDGDEEKVFEVKKSVLATTQPLKKYAQGLQSHMALDREGQLHIWKYGESGPSSAMTSAEKIQDFVIMQVTDVAPEIGTLRKKISD